MKRIILLYMLAVALAAQALSAKEVKILTIGNSFAQSVFQYLPQIARETPDCKLVLESANISGCSFQRHWKYITEEEADPQTKRYSRKRPNDAKLREILQSRKWDIVTIQQASHKSFLAETFAPEPEYIIEYVKKYAPSAEIVVQQTWSYRCDSPRLKKWNISQNEMFARAEQNYANLAKKFDLRVVPTGLAVQNCRKIEKNPFKPIPPETLKTFKYPNLPSDSGDVVGRQYYKRGKDGDWKLIVDYIHLNERGKYMQACLWFGFFFDKDPAEIKFVPKSIDPKEAETLRDVAAQTLRQFKQPRGKK